MNKYYLGGPMSGLPHFNIPAFDEAAENLRAKGYVIVSPAELDDKEVREASMASPDGKTVDGIHPLGYTWGDFLSRDVKVVADEVNNIILLPGWHKSRGAKLETHVAMLSRHKLWLYDPKEESLIKPLSYGDAASFIMGDYIPVKVINEIEYNAG